MYFKTNRKNTTFLHMYLLFYYLLHMFFQIYFHRTGWRWYFFNLFGKVAFFYQSQIYFMQMFVLLCSLLNNGKHIFSLIFGRAYMFNLYGQEVLTRKSLIYPHIIVMRVPAAFILSIFIYFSLYILYGHSICYAAEPTTLEEFFKQQHDIRVNLIYDLIQSSNTNNALITIYDIVKAKLGAVQEDLVYSSDLDMAPLTQDTNLYSSKRSRFFFWILCTILSLCLQFWVCVPYLSMYDFYSLRVLVNSDFTRLINDYHAVLDIYNYLVEIGVISD